MSVSRFLALGVFVLVIICTGNGNEVMAAPVPDPCNMLLRRRHPKTTTTLAPKIEDEKIIDSKRMLDEFLFWREATAPAPISEEPQKPKPQTMDMNSVFAAYIQFLTKFFNMF